MGVAREREWQAKQEAQKKAEMEAKGKLKSLIVDIYRGDIKVGTPEEKDAARWKFRSYVIDGRISTWTEFDNKNANHLVYNKGGVLARELWQKVLATAGDGYKPNNGNGKKELYTLINKLLDEDIKGKKGKANGKVRLGGPLSLAVAAGAATYAISADTEAAAYITDNSSPNTLTYQKYFGAAIEAACGSCAPNYRRTGVK